MTEQMLRKLREAHFVNVTIDMNNTSKKCFVKATHWVRRNVVPADSENDTHMGSSRFETYTAELAAVRNTFEECCEELIRRVRYEETTGDKYVFPAGFYEQN